jgi:hypothetical protein
MIIGPLLMIIGQLLMTVGFVICMYNFNKRITALEKEVRK